VFDSGVFEISLCTLRSIDQLLKSGTDLIVLHDTPAVLLRSIPCGICRMKRVDGYRDDVRCG
jgi:hypothetical protein